MGDMPCKNKYTVILLDTKAAAELLSVKEATLTDWRIQGIGPKWVKIGRLAKYDQLDVLEWIESRKTSSTARFGKLGAAMETLPDISMTQKIAILEENTARLAERVKKLAEVDRCTFDITYLEELQHELQTLRMEVAAVRSAYASAGGRS